MTRKQAGTHKRRVRPARIAVASLTMAAATAGLGGTAFASHFGSGGGCSNGSCHDNSVSSGEGTSHTVESRGTENCFLTEPGTGRIDNPNCFQS